MPYIFLFFLSFLSQKNLKKLIFRLSCPFSSLSFIREYILEEDENDFRGKVTVDQISQAKYHFLGRII